MAINQSFNRLQEVFGRSFFIMVPTVFVLFLLLVGVQGNDVKLWEDHDMAVNWANEGVLYYHNDGNVNHSFQFPIYPMTVGITYWLGGVNPMYAILINVFFVFLGVLALIDVLVLKQWINQENRWVGWTIFIGLMLYWPFQNYVLSSVHPFAMNFGWMCLMLRTGVLFFQNKTSWNYLALSVGIVMLQRPSLIMALLFFIPEISFVSRQPLVAVKILLVALVLPFIWMFRNYQLDGVFAMTSTSGKILWKGMIPESDGSNYIEGEKNYYECLSATEKETLKNSNVKEQDAFFKTLYSDLKTTHSGLFWQKYGQKLKSFWWFREGVGTEYPQMQKYIMVYQVFYVLLWLGVIIGLVKKPELWILILPFIGLSLFQSYFYVETRHRIILEPLLLCLNAIWLSNYWIQKRKWR